MLNALNFKRGFSLLNRILRSLKHKMSPMARRSISDAASFLDYRPTQQQGFHRQMKQKTPHRTDQRVPRAATVRDTDTCQLILGIPFEHVLKITEKYISALPNDIHITAIVPEIINPLISQWEQLSFESFGELEQDFKGVTDRLCAKHFGDFKDSGLLDAIK